MTAGRPRGAHRAERDPMTLRGDRPRSPAARPPSGPATCGGGPRLRPRAAARRRSHRARSPRPSATVPSPPARHASGRCDSPGLGARRGPGDRRVRHRTDNGTRVWSPRPSPRSPPWPPPPRPRGCLRRTAGSCAHGSESGCPPGGRRLRSVEPSSGRPETTVPERRTSPAPRRPEACRGSGRPSRRSRRDGRGAPHRTSARRADHDHSRVVTLAACT